MIDPSKIGEMMQQVQSMQAKMQADLKNISAEGQAGGGMVKVTLNGAFECSKVEIDVAVVDKDDVSMLQDLVQAAINAATTRIEEVRADQARDTVGQLGIPPGLF